MTWITEVKTLKFVMLLMSIGILLDGVSTLIALDAIESAIEFNPYMSRIGNDYHMVAFSMALRAGGLAFIMTILNIRSGKWIPSPRVMTAMNSTLILCLIVLFGIVALNIFQIYLFYADTVTVIDLPKGLTT